MNINNTCCNCKYFNKNYGYDGIDNGSCERLANNQLIILDVRESKYIAFYKDQNPSFVNVGANFGCIHFEENK